LQAHRLSKSLHLLLKLGLRLHQMGQRCSHAVRHLPLFHLVTLSPSLNQIL
jgi:exopolyphosphatase/pppGpp-phosphohydrolase